MVRSPSSNRVISIRSITDFLRDNSVSSVWLQYNRIDTADWAWADGSASTYTRWEANAPQSGDNVAVLDTTDSRTPIWRATVASTARQFVCVATEEGLDAAAIEPALTVTQEHTLDALDAVYRAHKLSGHDASWVDSRRFCMARYDNADIAVIPSAYIDRLVYGETDGHLLISRLMQTSWIT